MTTAVFRKILTPSLNPLLGAVIGAAGMFIGVTLIGLELLWDPGLVVGAVLIYWTGYFLGWQDKKRDALPRTITTREELDALPSCSVVLDSEGEPNILHDNGWVLPNGPGGYTSWAVAQTLPATVLWEPRI